VVQDEFGAKGVLFGGEERRRQSSTPGRSTLRVDRADLQ